MPVNDLIVFALMPALPLGDRLLIGYFGSLSSAWLVMRWHAKNRMWLGLVFACVITTFAVGFMYFIEDQLEPVYWQRDGLISFLSGAGSGVVTSLLVIYKRNKGASCQR